MSTSRWGLWGFSGAANAISRPPGSTVARLKLKWIDGARTSGGACGLIRCNAKNLTWPWHSRTFQRWIGAFGNLHTGAAWLSSARVVRCWVKSRNERNPFPYLPAFRMGTLRILPVTNWRKAGTTSSHHGPFTARATHVLQWSVQRVAT